MESEEKVLTYLNTQKAQKSLQLNLPAIKVDKLSGGYCNYVYRIHFSDNSTAVLKYYPPFLASNPQMKFSQQRLKVETEILKIIQEQNYQKLIKTPNVLAVDEEEYLLLMEDGGSESKFISLMDCLTYELHPENELLKEWPELTFESFFDALSSFLYQLNHLELSSVQKKLFKNEVAVEVLSNFYDNTFKERALRYQISTKDIPPFPVTGDYLIFGDLWPNSIFFNVETKTIWLLDWEGVRFGPKEGDFNQLHDNLWIMLQNKKKYNEKKIQKLMHLLGNRKDRIDFILQVVTFIEFPHWEIKDVKSAIENLLKESTAYQKVIQK